MNERRRDILLVRDNEKKNSSMCGRGSDRTVGSIVTKFRTQVLWRKILVECNSGLNRFNRFNMGHRPIKSRHSYFRAGYFYDLSILNTSRTIYVLNGSTIPYVFENQLYHSKAGKKTGQI